MGWFGCRAWDEVFFWRLLVCTAFFMLYAGGARAEDWLYVIRAGDNLWNVAERHLVSVSYVPRLQQLNRI